MAGTPLVRRVAVASAACVIALGVIVPTAVAAATYLRPDGFAPFEVFRVEYRDLDGDGDGFPDTGERGRVRVLIRYDGPALSDAVFVLSTGDPGVSCLEEWSMTHGPLAYGSTLWVGNLDPAAPGFTFRVGRDVQTTNPADPPRIDLCLRIVAAEFMFRENPGWTEPICFPLMADIDRPAAPRAWVAGPDGLPGTADDGTLAESFDLDRDGDGSVTINDLFRSTDAGTGTIDHAFYQRGGPPASGGSIGGVACGGFATFEEGNTACRLDPDYPMDWHLHCPPGSTTCPNLETGTCVGGCSYATPSDGLKSLSAPNSLHMGAHFNLADSRADTTHLRALQAFVSPPINLTPAPRAGDLEFSMFHIAALMDDNGVGGPSNISQCYDCADVQVQVDGDPDPAVDAWGAWDKLVPYQNVYDHKVAAWSAVPSETRYCLFTPADTGTAPPAPRGIHETMCNPMGAWSSCGSVRGTATTAVADCAGEGLRGQGTGVWVETRFNLGRFLGQRIRVRWVGGSWTFFGDASPTYAEVGSGFESNVQDDGWWLDNLAFTGVTIAQSPPDPDIGEPPPGSCPAVPCADADGDGFSASGSPPCPPDARQDCDDDDRLTYPGARESNDGRDNQCPGYQGNGLVDEVTGLRARGSLENDVCLTFDLQFGANAYQVVRSDRPTFPAPCEVIPFSAGGRCIQNEPDPPPGGIFLYLIRATTPYTGSWGADSSGNERQGICGL